MKQPPFLFPFLKVVLTVLILLILVATFGPLLFGVVRRFPLETLIIVGIVAVSASGVVLYIGELVVIGWAVDFLSEIGMPKLHTPPVPLEYQQIGEIVVVALHDIGTVFQCQAVQKQLKHLMDEQHCDLVLDFQYAGRISHSFREVLLYLAKAARNEAAMLGKPPVAHRAVFRVFDEKIQAVEEMSKHEGHGWVVLCSVPVGIRAVAGLTDKKDA